MRRSLILAALFATFLFGQQQHAADHQGAVNSRGDHSMGFSHEKTTHHFRLFTDGGAIEVEANDPKDTESRDQIRVHLKHIAQMFSAGNFEIPMFIHDQVPPGVPVMKRLADRIKYDFQETPRGGRVRITTQMPEAVTAVHDFLRFQIKDHHTGDSGEVGSKNQ
ncbi:MAG TPA: hypothetical protein VMU05_23270 [Dongiaceae bacterium]|nr:hypothetical protein [Dongiaceae bacterium]